jgi:hypothetical protein
VNARRPEYFDGGQIPALTREECAGAGEGGVPGDFEPGALQTIRRPRGIVLIRGIAVHDGLLPEWAVIFNVSLILSMLPQKIVDIFINNYIIKCII